MIVERGLRNQRKPLFIGHSIFSIEMGIPITGGFADSKRGSVITGPLCHGGSVAGIPTSAARGIPGSGTPCFLNLSGAIIILHTQFSAYVAGSGVAKCDYSVLNCHRENRVC